MARTFSVLTLMCCLVLMPPFASGQSIAETTEGSDTFGQSDSILDNKQTMEVVEVAEEESTSGGWLNTWFGWMGSQRDFLSDKVTGTAVVMDEYITRETFDDSIINESYLRVRFTQPISSGFDNQFTSKVRAVIDVPNAEEKIKFFLDSNPEDFDSISDRQRNISSEDQAQGEAVLGISFWETAGRAWNPSLSIGISTKPTELYSKIKLRKYRQLTDLWQSKFGQSFSYFDSKGAISNTQYNIFRPMAHRGILWTSFEAQFNQKEEFREIDPAGQPLLNDYWEFYHGWSYYRYLEEDTTIEYSINATALSRPNPRLENFWIRAEWRKLIHKDWLFFKITPEISFPRERDFKDTYSIFFELEIYIGKNFNPQKHLNF